MEFAGDQNQAPVLAWLFGAYGVNFGVHAGDAVCSCGATRRFRKAHVEV